MKCDFCNEEMIVRKEACFCEDGCFLCDNTQNVTVVQCQNPKCEPPDLSLEPWDN